MMMINYDKKLYDIILDLPVLDPAIMAALGIAAGAIMGMLHNIWNGK